MSYERLIPSMIDYAQKFRLLDQLDFKIIRTMLKQGVCNLSRVAKDLNCPQQTVSYHVKRFDDQDLVRFRALIDEPKLGLKSYSVTACAPIGREQVSGRALTSFHLWRYLAIVDGWKRGNFVRYAIPQDKEQDLVAFLKELERRELISDFEIAATSAPVYATLDLDFYSRTDRILTFEWQKWVQNLDSLSTEKTGAKVSYEKSEFDLIDLIILRCLEVNARTTQRKIVAEISRILGDKDAKKFIPLVSRRIRKSIEPKGLISGYRAYLFPNEDPSASLVMFYLVFTNRLGLEKFLAALNSLPYNSAYERTVDRDALFLRLIIPAYECTAMRKSFRSLAEQGYLKDAHLFFGEIPKGTWDNVEIYRMFKDNTWNFSYGAALEMLEKTLPRNHPDSALP
jgi:DNA-binding Lrp family transcriptional regulator